MKKPEQIQHEINLLIDIIQNIFITTRQTNAAKNRIQELKQLKLLIESGISEKGLIEQLNKLIEKRVYIKTQIDSVKYKILIQNKNPKREVKKLTKYYDLEYIEQQIKNLNYLLDK